MAMYHILAVRKLTHPNGFKGIEQVPTFFLESSVQGITSKEEAAIIARKVLESGVTDKKSVSFQITATKVE